SQGVDSQRGGMVGIRGLEVACATALPNSPPPRKGGHGASHPDVARSDHCSVSAVPPCPPYPPSSTKSIPSLPILRNLSYRRSSLTSESSALTSPSTSARTPSTNAMVASGSACAPP